MYAEVARLAGKMDSACENYQTARTQYAAYKAAFEAPVETLKIEMREIDDGLAECADL